MAPYDELFSESDTLENSVSKPRPNQELTAVNKAPQHPNDLENTASSINETILVEKNKTVSLTARTTSLSVKSVAAAPSFDKPCEEKAQFLLNAKDGPLGNEDLFADVARMGNYGHVDFETYRMQMLATAQGKALQMPVQSWHKWIIGYLNQDRMGNKLLLAIQGPPQHRQNGLEREDN